MINILIFMICLVIIGLLLCIYKCRKTDTKVAKSISRLLSIALVTVTSYLIFGFSDNDMAAYIFATIYCGSIDWLLVGFFDFSIIYTEFSFTHIRINIVICIISIVDNILLILNIYMHNAFLIHKNSVLENNLNSKSDFGIIFYFHLMFSYIMVIGIIVVMYQDSTEKNIVLY